MTRRRASTRIPLRWRAAVCASRLDCVLLRLERRRAVGAATLLALAAIAAPLVLGQL